MRYSSPRIPKTPSLTLNRQLDNRFGRTPPDNIVKSLIAHYLCTVFQSITTLYEALQRLQFFRDHPEEGGEGNNNPSTYLTDEAGGKGEGGIGQQHLTDPDNKDRVKITATELNRSNFPGLALYKNKDKFGELEGRNNDGAKRNTKASSSTFSPSSITKYLRGPRAAWYISCLVVPLALVISCYFFYCFVLSSRYLFEMLLAYSIASFAWMAIGAGLWGTFYYRKDMAIEKFEVETQSELVGLKKIAEESGDGVGEVIDDKKDH